MANSAQTEQILANLHVDFKSYNPLTVLKPTIGDSVFDTLASPTSFSPC